jgi:hypothetical protein
MKKKIVSIMIFFTLVFTGIVFIPITVSADAVPVIDKYMNESEGELGDVINITIDVEIPEGLTNNWVYDYLPWGFEYVFGSYMINGVYETPFYYDDDLIYDNFTVPGIYQITFKTKIVEAKSWGEIEVINTASIYWENDTGWYYSEDNVTFTILPFEELHKNVGIPKADVVFSFDLTGSMGTVIVQAQENATKIINDLQTSISDVAFGVISHVDYPHYYEDYCGYTSQYGDNDSDWDGYGDIFGDYAYKTDLDITEDATTAISTIAGLSLYSGGDGPQNYARVLNESRSLSWREDSVKYVILFGDNLPHDCDYWSYSTGGDPGEDEIAGTADDIDFETVIANLATDGIKVLAIDCSYLGVYSAFYQYMADETGGHYFTIGDTGVPETIEGLLKSAAEDVEIMEKTWVQWPVFIDVENPYEFPMNDTRIYDRFGGEIQIDYIKTEDTNYTFEYLNYNKKKAEVEIYEDGILIGTYDLDKDGVTLGAEPYEFYIYWTGKSHKIHFQWNIGTLNPEEFIGIIIGASTDTNPAGHQEYTSPGIYELNSGATLKFSDPYTQLSAYTDSVYVTVLPE